ncbi:MAG: hypothetical protein IT165_35800 [Bryobacterales bacterium]|nr:hypothetical protein [Bryobacterales bacterium]
MRAQNTFLTSLVLAGLFAELVPLYAQQPVPPSPPPATGWRKFGEATPRRDAAPPPGNSAVANEEPATPEPPPTEQGAPPPSQLIMPAGTWLKVRVDQPISSDHNQPGDVFTGTLVQPLVVNGLVVARRGQTIAGRVAEAEKAGRSKGTSRLGIELTEISLVDGQQIPIRSQLVEYNGGTSKGRDATAIGVTTGTGAAIGAAAAGGFGAGMGAIAGAAASTIGVLLTRGRATEIYPEAVLTFRTLAPLTINTENSAQAFQPVRQQDYEPRLQQRVSRPAPPAPYYYGYDPFFYSPFYSPYYYGWGPSFYYFSGPRFYRGFGGGFRGRGGWRR